MSGHSKWASIKHKKAAVDAKRGKMFTKVIKEITVAARLGGGDPDTNPRLRLAIANAKDVNMPHDNVQRAIKKGTGELEGASYEEVTYEGYGPAGVAVMVEVMTDNKNRTVAEIRSIFSKNGGNLGEGGCVAWQFEKKGLVLMDEGQIEEDALLDIVLTAGAEDLRKDGLVIEIVTAPDELEQVRQALEAHQLTYSSARVSMLPQSTIQLDGKHAQQMLRLMDALEDHEDVQNCHANFDIPEEVMAAMTTH
ncbi:MAG: YebC/PmpR family DNA-binding transcriptional regulator [Candidatus Tectomicrobia bacterium]|nr:YebC/PmpR family DNA-binding transcriptional regulator [Candidatus Tectomicrobia bacterium]